MVTVLPPLSAECRSGRQYGDNWSRCFCGGNFTDAAGCKFRGGHIVYDSENHEITDRDDYERLLRMQAEAMAIPPYEVSLCYCGIGGNKVIRDKEYRMPHIVEVEPHHDIVTLEQYRLSVTKE